MQVPLHRCRLQKTVTSVRSVTLRSLRRHRLVQEPQVHSVVRTTKCVLPSERQDHVHGKTAHSNMKQRQRPRQPQQRRRTRKRSLRLSPSQRLNPVLWRRKLQSQSLSLPLLQFECAEHGIHWRLLYGRGPRTWRMTSRNALLLIAT